MKFHWVRELNLKKISYSYTLIVCLIYRGSHLKMAYSGKTWSQKIHFHFTLHLYEFFSLFSFLKVEIYQAVKSICISKSSYLKQPWNKWVLHWLMIEATETTQEPNFFVVRTLIMENGVLSLYYTVVSKWNIIESSIYLHAPQKYLLEYRWCNFLYILAFIPATILLHLH